jgi:hypothetical protein
MPDANSGMGSHREGRQERRRVPRQPGATGAKERNATPEEAMEETRHRFGKTEKHVSDDR